MNNDHIISSLNKELDDLESKIEELSNKYLDLKKENQLLKERQEIEVSEKFKIIEKNQSSGVIKISLDENAEESKGFLARMFGDNSAQVMNIKVTTGGDNGESTLIKVEDDAFVQIQSLASDEILRGLYVKLK